MRPVIGAQPSYKCRLQLGGEIGRKGARKATSS